MPKDSDIGFFVTPKMITKLDELIKAVREEFKVRDEKNKGVHCFSP